MIFQDGHKTHHQTVIHGTIQVKIDWKIWGFIMNIWELTGLTIRFTKRDDVAHGNDG